VSQLSSDEDAGFRTPEDEFVAGAEAEEEQEVKCRRCGGMEFRARKVIANPGGSTGQKLVCGKCGLICE